MEQNFHKLYGEIVRILREDYAGIDECAESFTPRYYTQAIGQAGNDGRLDELQFLRYVNQMLACTGDRHLRFSLRAGEGYEPYSVGFCVRRFEDELIVTEVTDDDRFAVGDRITAIHGGSPAHHRRCIEKNFFYADEPEREDWTGFLKMAENVDVQGKGCLSLRHFPRRDSTRQPSLRVEGDTVIFCPGDFDGSGRAAALADREAETLARCRRLVWDMRRCGGCAEEDFYPLLPWLITQETDRAVLLGDTELYVNYSRRNCLLKAQQIARLPGADVYLEELRRKAGSGYVLEKIEAEHEPLAAKAGGPVLVLTDMYCRDAGEAFVRAAGRAGAKLVGRATMGTLDYCGDVSVLLGERFVLTWPTAVTAEARNGAGMKGCGIVPDRPVPYTPEECERDLILAAALKESENL